MTDFLGTIGGLLGGPLGAGAGSLLNQGLGGLGSIFGSGFAQGNVEQMKRQRKMDAYNKAMADVTGDLSGGEKSFEQAVGAPSQQLAKTRQSIAQGGQEAQQQAAGQNRANLALQGVRGPQASIIAGRQAGQLATDLNRQLEQMSLNEAQRQSGTRAGYYGGKAGTAQAQKYNLANQGINL